MKKRIKKIMGCDIHLYIEVKNKNGEWEHVEIPKELIPDDRDYEVFSFLAAVRVSGGDYDSQFEHRGFPSDTSWSDSGESWMGDHSYTYATLSEINKAPWEEAGLHKRYFPIFCDYVLPRILLHKHAMYVSRQHKDCRILMGFDS